MEIIQPKLFAELRTKKQLGYTVIGAFTFYRGVVGAMIKIQSSKYNPEQLEHEINEFLKNIRNTYKAKGEFDPVEVNKVIGGLAKNLNLPKVSSSDEAKDTFAHI